jgi:hypothetical protein
MADRARFQYRMRDLAWAVSLIAAALGLGLAFVRLRARFDLEYSASAMDSTGPVALWYWLVVAAYMGAGVLGGAGVGCLFRGPHWGAAIGAGVAVLIEMTCRKLGHPLLPHSDI